MCFLLCAPLVNLRIQLKLLIPFRLLSKVQNNKARKEYSVMASNLFATVATEEWRQLVRHLPEIMIKGRCGYVELGSSVPVWKGVLGECHGTFMTTVLMPMMFYKVQKKSFQQSAYDRRIFKSIFHAYLVAPLSLSASHRHKTMY